MVTDRAAQKSAYANLDALLDDALQMTFPASDPIALGVDRLSAAGQPQRLTSSSDARERASTPANYTDGMATRA